MFAIKGVFTKTRKTKLVLQYIVLIPASLLLLCPHPELHHLFYLTPSYIHSPFLFSICQITVLEEEQETVCQMYNLINMYSIPTPPEDLVVFATLQPSINSLHSIIDEAAAERDSSMNKFCVSLRKDIKELNREIMKVKLKSQVHSKLLLPFYQPKNT